MAGYKREARVYQLNFDGTEFEGLVVKAKSISTAKLMQLMKLAVRFSEENGGTKRQFGSEDFEAIEGLLDGFGEALVDWNLEDDDGPVPATREGLGKQDFDFAFGIIMPWLNAVGAVSPDLGKDSTSGPQFPEASLPMAPLSPNPGS